MKTSVLSAETALWWMMGEGIVKIPGLASERSKEPPKPWATRTSRAELARKAGCRMVGGRCQTHGGALARGPEGIYCRHAIELALAGRAS